MAHKLQAWNPNDAAFWEQTGHRVARKNLLISLSALLLAFCVWQMWSAMALNLPKAGFSYTTDQMFTLTALPALTCAFLRVLYSIAVPYVGGRNWTVISTALLLVPTIGIGLALQNPNTSFTTMAVLSALCGFGGANFSSSMANIGPFYPKEKQGTALGLNGGIGNLGVSVAQLLIPIAITIPLLGRLGGGPQTMQDAAGTRDVWLQNGALIWVIPIALVTVLALLGMDNLPLEKPSLRRQAQVFRRKHMYLITILYVMSFGSFIGYSAAFPLLIQNQFPDVNPLQYAFIGPLLGALGRPVGGVLADKFGGALISTLDVIFMIFGTLGVIYFISGTPSFTGFFLMFLLMFAAGGIANGSIFQMIPFIFGPVESPAAIGFSTAIGSFGGFFIPKMFGWSLQHTGSAQLALWIFVGYYALCAWILWYYYARKQANKPAYM